MQDKNAKKEVVRKKPWWTKERKKCKSIVCLFVCFRVRGLHMGKESK